MSLLKRNDQSGISVRRFYRDELGRLFYSLSDHDKNIHCGEYGQLACSMPYWLF
jgi:hypothetical protein